jgi:hypothetical protein
MAKVLLLLVAAGLCLYAAVRVFVDGAGGWAWVVIALLVVGAGLLRKEPERGE